MKQNKLLKHLLAVLLLALLPQAATAYDFMVGGLCYNKNSDGTSVTVTYQNSSWPRYSNLSGNLVIPATVTYNGTTYSVTSIGDNAFDNCRGLTSVTIPNSVTSIGWAAFRYCSGLTSVTIGNSVTSIDDSAFESCSGLTSVTIPNSVTSIGNCAFRGCSGIKKLTWNAINCSSMGSMPTYNIEQVTISYGVKVLPDNFVQDSKITSVTIPNSVTSIGDRAFSGCRGLTSVTIPNSVTSIGYEAFYNCSGLTSVTIPNSVTSIGDCAFERCSGLTSVTIPNSVTSIGSSAFKGCSGLESMVVKSGNSTYDSRDNCNAIIETASNTLVAGCKATTIPNSVTSIGDNAFWGCSGLTSVTIPNSVTSIGDDAFEYCSGLTSLTIGNSVTSIGNHAFESCSGLTSVTIPNSVTSIGSGAFEYCSGLTGQLTIPNSITSIGNYAFRGCSGLTSVTIPNSVTSIGNSAFYDCSGLRAIHSEVSDPANVQLGSNAFDNVPKSTCVLVVSAASLESYQSASPWNEFTNIFAEMTSLDIKEQSFELINRKKQAIDVTTQPDNAWNFVWTSSDNSIATVDENGTVTAVSLGTATITAKYIFDSNLSDSCLVTVIPNYDVNDDDKVDIADVGLLINKMLEKNGALSMEYTDMNGDNIVDIFDINEVISVMLGNGNLPEPPTPLQTYTVNGVSFTMVTVEGGTFTMGATPEQGSDAYSEEKPAHQVTLSNYRIGQTEVTQELWQAVMGSNPSYFTGDLQRPVECVSWDDCQTFITKLNQLTGKNFRLPTEAEWEYAARGGNQSQGYKYAGSNNVDEVAWHSGNSSSTTHTVATKAANELGIYDMSGNVLEWCQDWYGSYSSDAQTNPTGPASGSRRTFRGGSYSHTNIGCNRVSWRYADDPTKKYINLGFRLAL